MTALLDQVATRDTANRKAAIATYAELLARQSTPEDGDADTLREVMSTLNLTQADVANDALIVRQVVEHERGVAAAEVPTEAAARTERVKLAAARLDAATRELREAEQEHNVAWGEIQQLSRSASVFRIEASRLRQQNPRAFGQELPAPAANPHRTRFVGGMQPN